MNTHPDNPPDASREIDREVLISRLLDGRAKPEDWRAFRAAAERQGIMWDDLIESATDLQSLSRAVNLVAEGTTCIDVHEAARRDAGRLRSGGLSRINRLGWLVAACLALGLISVTLRQRDITYKPAPVNQAGFLSSMTSQQLMDQYYEAGKREGRVIGELPQVTELERRPLGEGKGYEVLYLRHVLERAVVDDVYKLGTDDAGQPVVIPAGLRSRPSGPM